MKNKIKVAVLGSTGYVGMELVKILSNHSYLDINFLGSETIHDSYLNNIDNTQEYNQLPLLRPNNSFNTEDSESGILHYGTKFILFGNDTDDELDEDSIDNVEL